MSKKNRSFQEIISSVKDILLEYRVLKTSHLIRKANLNSSKLKELKDKGVVVDTYKDGIRFIELNPELLNP